MQRAPEGNGIDAMGTKRRVTQAPSSLDLSFGSSPPSGEQATAKNTPSPRAASSLSLIPKMLMFRYADKKRDAAAKNKGKFQVQVPTRAIRYVMFIFFVLPLVLFFYKETHRVKDIDVQMMHKSRVKKIDPKAVLSHLAENVNGTDLEAVVLSKKSSGDAPKGDASDEGKDTNAADHVDDEHQVSSSSSDREGKKPPAQLISELEHLDAVDKKNETAAIKPSGSSEEAPKGEDGIQAAGISAKVSSQTNAASIQTGRQKIGTKIGVKSNGTVV